MRDRCCSNETETKIGGRCVLYSYVGRDLEQIQADFDFCGKSKTHLG